MGSWRYLLFILRELTSVAVAWSVVLTCCYCEHSSMDLRLILASCIGCKSPWMIAFNVIAFCFLAFAYALRGSTWRRAQCRFA